MVTLQEIELLASLTQRAGVTRIEVIWLNDIFDRLRILVTAEETKKQQAEPKKS